MKLEVYAVIKESPPSSIIIKRKKTPVQMENNYLKSMLILYPSKMTLVTDFYGDPTPTNLKLS